MRLKPMEALEEVTNTPPGESGQAFETEIVLYCKIGKFDGLEECNRQEKHVQLEGSFSTGTKCRVRKVTDDTGKDTYTFTFKLKEGATDGGSLVQASVETNIEVDEVFFENFRKGVATREIHKTRYTFDSKKVTFTMKKDDGEPMMVEVPNVQYEVDVFDFEGATREEIRCKIDVEVDVILDFLKQKFPEVKEIKLTMKVSHLPFMPEEVLAGHTEDPEERELIDNAWKKFVKPLNTPE